MSSLIAWRIVFRYLILGLVFVPAVALWFHEQSRPVEREVGRGRAAIAQDVTGKPLYTR